jgi:hypothetical protein
MADTAERAAVSLRLLLAVFAVFCSENLLFSAAKIERSASPRRGDPGLE